MKTTLELPDHLYRQVKATAALQKKTVKDLVTRGLELVLQEEGDHESSPLNILEEIQNKPPYSHSVVMEMQDNAYRLRKEGWAESSEK